MASLKFQLFGAVLLLSVFGSQALTLGRLRGAALIGQGLDVVVQAQLDAGDDPSSVCVEAEVYYADARQDPSRVQVVVQPAQPAPSANIRISSSIRIDEPVVTVYLHAGCAQKSSRRYVLLADVVSDAVAETAPLAPQVPLISPAISAASATPAAPAAPGPVAKNAATSGGAGVGSAASAQQGLVPARPVTRVAKRTAVAGDAKSAPVAPVRKPARAKAASPVSPMPPADEKLAAGRAAGQSRLKLDPLEVLSERVATLESSAATAPAQTAALDARDAQRLAALEASVKSLLVVAAKNEAALVEMRARLEQVESERLFNPLFYGLAALLAGCLAVFAYLQSRRGRRFVPDEEDNLWSGAANVDPVSAPGKTVPARASGFSATSAPAPMSGPDSLPGVLERPQEKPRHRGPRSKPAPLTQVDVSLVEMSESTFDRLMQSDASHSAVRRPPAARPAQPAQPVSGGKRRMINYDELLDIRQQAEFFVSLGQTDQAVRVLENRISESGESSPLAYLDLLKIFHSLGLKADFRQVREDFTLLFNARVPEFAGFNDEGKDLEAYPETLRAITSAWGSADVFAAVEGCLYRDEWHAAVELFDVAAFRDLLLLHAVAQSAASMARVEPVTASAADRRSFATPSQVGLLPSGDAALSAAVALASPLDGPLDLDLPLLEGLPELDIDLSDLPLDLPELPLPEVKAGPGTAMEAASGAAPGPSVSGNLIDFDEPAIATQSPLKIRK